MPYPSTLGFLYQSVLFECIRDPRQQLNPSEKRAAHDTNSERHVRRAHYEPTQRRFNIRALRVVN